MSDFEQRLSHVARNLKTLPDKPDETPESTLRALWAKAAGLSVSADRSMTLPLKELDSNQKDALDRMIERRLGGVPLGHITGRQMFMGIELEVTPDALLPRRETEILGRAASATAADLLKERGGLLVVDTCCGSGNVGLAVANSDPKIRVICVDLSPDSVGLAELNAARIGLVERMDFRVGDLLTPVGDVAGTVDLITCNPPYISTASVKTMDEEISNHEPSMAFDGGPFGIKILNRLIKEAPLVLRPGGGLAFEVGLGQGEPTSKRLKRMGAYASIESFKDPSGAIRAIVARVA